jgi:hypothetical protein
MAVAVRFGDQIGECFDKGSIPDHVSFSLEVK